MFVLWKSILFSTMMITAAFSATFECRTSSLPEHAAVQPAKDAVTWQVVRNNDRGRMLSREANYEQ